MLNKGQSIPIALLALVVLTAAGNAQSLTETDRIRIAEAFGISHAVGDRLWVEWNDVPFAILLVSEEHEFLVGHPRPSEEFVSIGYDSLLGDTVRVRDRIFPTNLLASFPAVGGVPTVVIGRAENTQAKTSSKWVATLQHEHLHQIQMAHPDYGARIAALGLAQGDETGSWVLNYSFPYDSAVVQEAIATLAQALARAVSADTNDFRDALQEYLALRSSFRHILDEDDYKYFSLQLWQEGVSMYVEYRMADLAATSYQPSPAFRALPDFRTFGNVANGILDNILDMLPKLQSAEMQRVVFYYLGAGEALLLDRVNPDWRRDYFPAMFSLDGFWERVEY